MVPLAVRLFKVYKVMHVLKSAPPESVHKHLRSRKVISATYNSLAALVKLGLVSRKRVGRMWLYSIK